LKKNENVQLGWGDSKPFPTNKEKGGDLKKQRGCREERAGQDFFVFDN